MLRLERLALYSAIVVLSVAVFTRGPASADGLENAEFNVLTVRQVKLVDANGKLLIHMLPNNAGHGTVALLNTVAKMHTQLTTNAHGAGMLLMNSKDGVRIASLGAGAEGGEVATFNMAGKLGTLSTTVKSGGIVSAFTGELKRVAYLGAATAGNGIMFVATPQGQARAEVACRPDGNGEIKLWGKDGKLKPIISTAPTQPK